MLFDLTCFKAARSTGFSKTSHRRCPSASHFSQPWHVADSKLLGAASVGTSEVGLQEQLEHAAKASISPGKRSAWSIEEMPTPTVPHLTDGVAYSLDLVSMMLMRWALMQMGSVQTEMNEWLSQTVKSFQVCRVCLSFLSLAGFRERCRGQMKGRWACMRRRLVMFSLPWQMIRCLLNCLVIQSKSPVLLDYRTHSLSDIEVV